MPAHLDRGEIREALDPQNVRPLQILHVALAAGVALFAAFVYYTYMQHNDGTPALPADVTSIRTFSLVNALVAVAAHGLGHLLFRQRISSLRPEEIGDTEALVGALRGAYILRLGVTEGSALLGVVVCFLGATKNVLQNFPDYWWNLLPAAAFIVFVGLTIPTREKLLELLGK